MKVIFLTTSLTTWFPKNGKVDIVDPLSRTASNGRIILLVQKVNSKVPKNLKEVKKINRTISGSSDVSVPDPKGFLVLDQNTSNSGVVLNKVFIFYLLLEIQILIKSIVRVNKLKRFQLLNQFRWFLIIFLDIRTISFRFGIILFNIFRELRFRTVHFEPFPFRSSYLVFLLIQVIQLVFLNWTPRFHQRSITFLPL